MGFIDYLFRKKKQQNDITITAHELLPWFDNNIRGAYFRMDSTLNSITNEIKDEINRAKENVADLKNANLINPDITQREKDFMKGNRESYIMKMNLFLNQINPIVIDYTEMLASYDKFKHDIGMLGKSTLKSFHILNEFFSEEMAKISANLRKLDNKFNAIHKAITESGINEIELIKGMIRELTNKINIRCDYDSILHKKLEELEEQKRLLGVIAKHTAQFRDSREFNEYNELIKKQDGIENKMKLVKEELNNYIIPLQKALIKFEKINLEDGDFLNECNTDLIGALLNHGELRIIKLLEQIKDNTNKLGLKEKKKEKMLDTINMLNKDFFTNFLVKYNNLSKELHALNLKSENNKIIGYYNELINKKENHLLILNNMENEIENIKRESRKIDTNHLRDEITGKIKKELGVNVKIC